MPYNAYPCHFFFVECSEKAYFLIGKLASGYVRTILQHKAIVVIQRKKEYIAVKLL